MKKNVFLKHPWISSFLLLLTSLVFMWLVSEGILFFLKYDNTWSAMQKYPVVKADWWTNDSLLGPRYVAGHYQNTEHTAPHWFYERLKTVNRQGYPDKEDFTEIPADTNLTRILFAGDSFTWGASSDADSSYVEVFERKIKQSHPVVVWNAGISGVGTSYAIQVTKRFLPLQKTDVVILGFFYNDFRDNLVPYDGLVFFDNGACFNCYALDDEFHAKKISLREAYKTATGSYPVGELNFFQREIIIKSRVIALFRKTWKQFMKKHWQNESARDEYMFRITNQYLGELNEYIKENHARLLVLLIPERPSATYKDNYYLKAKEMLKEMGIDHIDIRDRFCDADYSPNKSDEHWSNSGHRIAGTLLYDFVLHNYVLIKPQDGHYRKEGK